MSATRDAARQAMLDDTRRLASDVATRLESLDVPYATRKALADAQAIAARLLAKGIASTIFDRGGFRYHGRIKALADAAREGGLQF